ncbi:uncharacterized protein RSE6_11589 [Rhynchosporium secalis]|uniref:Uncharacterized protein n=1 Tax=Rhynchosporium secalis TaxID=38038 RepID=A0A1E1MNA9_RHYSE|nr:uncharacterized protein RSE6_11589 [Rhynchosporium secalis]
MGYIFMQWDDLWPELMYVVCGFSQEGTTRPRNRSCRLDQDSPGPSGCCCREKARDLPSSRASRNERFSATGGPHIRFKDFRVPGANFLEAARRAVPVITRDFSSSAALVGAIATGIMAVAFEAALTFAKSDARGGSQALLARQSVSDLWMNVKLQTDAARAMKW